MARGDETLDAVIIGAGWAGLGVSHALKARGIPHRVLERARIGETWRTQRWDSFHINTPNLQSVMPGDSYAGPDPNGAMNCREFIALLEDYAQRHELPVETDTPVTELVANGDSYRLTTPRGTLMTRSVVIATGNQNYPIRPSLAAALPSGLRQIDASQYRSAASLDDGAVLVVGSAQSGGQIAEDLAEAGRTVFLSTSKSGRLPTLYRGSHISIWMVRTGLFDVTRQEMIEQQGRLLGRPLVGALHTISLQSLSQQGVVLLGRFTGVDGNSMTFGDQAEEHVRHADERSASIRRMIDEYIADAAIDAPDAEPDPAEVVAARLPDPPIRSLDLAKRGITTVIWCTGFKGDFRWARIPGLLDAEGQPVHIDGVAAVPGIFFAGLAFAISRRSGTILAIAEEASRYAALVAARRDGR